MKEWKLWNIDGQLNALFKMMAPLGHLYAEPFKKITGCSTIGVRT